MSTFGSVFELSSLDGTNGFQMNGEASLDFSGYSAASAGDINGDGFDDLIIGAVLADPNGTYSGAAYVVFGAASGFSASLDLSTLNGTNGFKINGAAAYDGFGRSVASAGDINGDGFDDLIIGAFGADPNGSYSGASYVVFGSSTEFSANLELSTLTGSTGFRIIGESADDHAGFSVASAGDVNGDGIDDLIIGARGAAGNDSYSGASYVVFGTGSAFNDTLELSALDGSKGFQINGEAAVDQFGFSVASAGDVNGDGYDDLIIGARYADPNSRNNSGATYVVFGAAGFGGDLNLSSLNGADGFQINGEVAGDQSGRSVASAGDINGDGYDDLIIGALYSDPNGDSSGASYVVFGAASGFAANLSLSALNGTNGFQINGEAADNRAGFSVASAGDINGDGFDDLIIGADRADPDGGQDYGASYVVFGTASGFSASIELSDLDGSDGFRIDGEGFAENLGISVASAGDVNDDGYDDLIVGAIGAPNGNLFGASYVIFGRAPDEAVSRTGTSIANTIRGGTFNDTISGLSGDDELYGAAGNDSLDGGAGNDRLTGGAGSDTYVTEGSDTITEESDSGTDTVQSSATYALGANLENLTLTGSAAINGTGNGLNNTLTGNSAANALSGGNGNDTYVVGANDTVTEASGSGSGTDTVQSSATLTLGSNLENLTLTGSSAINGTGNALNNTLTGNSAANTLSGGTGTDILVGGSGNDIYVMDSSDTITEASGSSSGTDTVQSSVTYTLGANLENLTLTGTSAINGTGNTLNNTLTGNSAANTLSGGAGTDILVGGSGNDIYVTDGGDTITEASGTGSGTDAVQTSATYALGDNLENLTLTGTATINGTGNTLNNTLMGNSAANSLDGGTGADTLNGGTGKDLLTGAAGNDTFIFNTVVESAITATTTDVIADFVIGQDKISLSGIDAFASSSTNDAFIWKGTDAFGSTTKGEVRYQKFDKPGTANDHTMVWIDNDADTDVEMAIRLTGLYNLTAGDFIL